MHFGVGFTGSNNSNEQWADIRAQLHLTEGWWEPPSHTLCIKVTVLEGCPFPLHSRPQVLLITFALLRELSCPQHWAWVRFAEGVKPFLMLVLRAQPRSLSCQSVELPQVWLHWEALLVQSPEPMR